MAKDTILVLGTGATLGGQFKVKIGGKCYAPPLDKNFFQTEAVKSIFKECEYPALFYYQRECGLEPTWANIDLVAKMCLSKIIDEEGVWESVKNSMAEKAKGDTSYKNKMKAEKSIWRVPSMAGWELLSLIHEVYKETVPPKEKSPLWQVVSKLIEEDLLKGVITFNYDTSLETLLRRHNQGFYYPCLPSQSGGLPLIKLHGSLNWQYFHFPYEESITVVDTLVKPEHSVYGYTQPEIVGPTFFKQEITIDYQQDYRAKYYKALWRFAWEQLREMQKLVFIGFSFPQTDFHAAALFRTAHLSGLGFRRVVLCHKSDDGGRLKDTVKKVFEQKARNGPEFNDYTCGLEILVKNLDELVKWLQCNSSVTEIS